MVGLEKGLRVIEIKAKTVLSPSKVYDYTVNPYFGCGYGCTYCYVRMMMRFRKVSGRWGEFVLAKVNAPEILKKEVSKKKRGKVWLSGMCDPYQPVEREMRLTRKCLEILFEHNFSVVIQTKSDLILDDIDLLTEYEDLEVMFTISTAKDSIREMFEPKAPSILRRIDALKRISKKGIKCKVMIAPLLPGCENVVDMVKDDVVAVYIDKMNYWFANGVYEKNGLSWANTYEFFQEMASSIVEKLKGSKIRCYVLF